MHYSDNPERGPNEEDPNAEIFEGLQDGGVGSAEASDSTTSSTSSSSKELSDVKGAIRDHDVADEDTTTLSSGHNTRGKEEDRNEVGDVDNDEEETEETEGKANELQSHVIYDHLHQV